MTRNQASQAPAAEGEALANALAAKLVAARSRDRLFLGMAVLFNTAALVLFVCGWPGLAGLCIWAAILISVTRMVQE